MREENRRAEVRPASGSPGDADLLRRFAADRCEEAFATLVRRHGPLVLSVCRRVLGDVPDAEDAFQATFLVLARRAGSIADPERLGNWLYGVAARVALKARGSLRRRQAREKQVRLPDASPNPAPPSTDDDSAAVLREELGRLPEKYRAAVGLCYLEGKSNAETAGLLRWPIGTVKGRLARARELLRSRLAGRGLGVTT
jgi:RNA polymerase sigma-70 factor (ECF subfamily)